MGEDDILDSHDDIDRLLYHIHRNVAAGLPDNYEGDRDEANCTHGISNTAFSDLLESIRELLPEAKLPKSFYEAKKVVKDIGLHYDKIDTCRNDCMLYWKEYGDATSCHVCHASREKDGLLRHPADGEDWKEFDKLYPTFGSESRNVRLGLASDGFNPFRTMNTQHSTWPVVLINYNLPPWLIMKSEFLILSLLIPGPASPGNDIDVYLQPLIEELKDLWCNEFDTYDASKKETFKMYAALRSTTSDFPGYAMLSSYTTKGKFACPYCHYETGHRYLSNSNKSCYMAHRRFLDADHPWRYDTKAFDGETEERAAPEPLTVSEIEQLLKDWKNSFGKLQPKKKNDDCPWRKSSIFHTLVYCKDLRCLHHLDVMHIEKNICDSVLGTLLDIPGKSKDHHKARLDLQEMGIRPELHPQESGDDRYVLLPKASFSMSKEDKSMFCSVIKKSKLPAGCTSDISREHEEVVKQKLKNNKKRRWSEAQQHSNELTRWFKEKVELDNVPEHIKWLSLGPSTIARRYTGYFCNGYKFYTKEHDDKCKTQNSGVSLTALTPSFATSKDINRVIGDVTYYGVIKSIVELDYWTVFSVVLFECDWFHTEVDDCGLTRVNFKTFLSKDDPFVLSLQVHQVFYMEDGVDKDFHYVNRMLPRDFFYAEGQYEDRYTNRLREPVGIQNVVIVNDDEIRLCREGISKRVNVHQMAERTENDSDVDETDWDWMEPMN
ncbi:hypothetical protein LIER_25448 [Lithospermum erythrorhizon]|uniref:DUF4216 domain-containing protein n=1 Tax=Lithospermum erythrorhizon TaxID=34254 RepID=A0AAV3R6C4_LITER